MARSLIGGLASRGVRADTITVSDPVAAQRETLERQFGVRTTPDNKDAAAAGEVIVLAVKPQELRLAVKEIAPLLAGQRKLLISIAAGVRAGDIERWSGGAPLVRCMPNRPALNGCGITALYATHGVSARERTLAEQILGAVGATLWVDEEGHMDAVTAISGSGPAYFFLLIEMLEQTGVALGLTPEVSRKLAVETAYGAGSMARAATDSAAVLREQVTSKGGTTEAALRYLESQNIRDVFAGAVTAAARRSAELADQLGGD